MQGLWHIEQDVDWLDLGRDKVDGVSGRVEFDNNFAVWWVHNDFALDRQAAHQLGLDTGAASNPPHVDAHVAEHLHVDAATTSHAMQYSTKQVNVDVRRKRAQTHSLFARLLNYPGQN